MNRRQVGLTGLSVTELGFGAAAIGGLFKPSAADVARAAVDAAWDVGIRYFDTAPHYGLGLSERRLGEALRGRPRDEYVLSTKVACAGRGVSVLAAAPFNSGLLARAWPPDDAHFNYEPAPAHVLEHARLLARRSEQHGLTLPQAALRFPLRHEAVACVVAGLEAPEHVRSAAGWLAGPVPDVGWMQEVATP